MDLHLSKQCLTSRRSLLAAIGMDFVHPRYNKSFLATLGVKWGVWISHQTTHSRLVFRCTARFNGTSTTTTFKRRNESKLSGQVNPPEKKGAISKGTSTQARCDFTQARCSAFSGPRNRRPTVGATNWELKKQKGETNKRVQ